MLLIGDLVKLTAAAPYHYLRGKCGRVVAIMASGAVDVCIHDRNCTIGVTLEPREVELVDDPLPEAE